MCEWYCRRGRSRFLGDALGAVLGRADHGVLGVVVPKAGDPEALAELTGSLGPDLAVLAIVESALGVVRAYELAAPAQSPWAARSRACASW